MRTKKGFQFVAIFILFINVGRYTNAQIRSDKLKVINNVWYQYSSSSAIINRISVRKNIQCAGQCILNPSCRTATFDQANQLCLLLSEFTSVGQLITNNKAITYEHQSTNSISTTLSATSTLLFSSTSSTVFKISTVSKRSTTTTRVTTPSACTAVIPAFGNTWTCINVSQTISNGNNERFYLKSGVILTTQSMGALTVYLESNAQLRSQSSDNINAYLMQGAKLTSESNSDLTVYLASGAVLTSQSSDRIIAYLESRAKLSVTSSGDITGYLKSNSSISSTSSGSNLIYYETGATMSYVSPGSIIQNLCPSIIFDYSNIPLNGC